MSDVDHSVKLSVRMSDWILDKELDGEGKETLEMLRGIRDEVEELEEIKERLEKYSQNLYTTYKAESRKPTKGDDEK